MQDYSKEELETGYGTLNAEHTVNFCLNQLYADKTHKLSDEVVDRLTFEELIGALLIAKKTIQDGWC